MSGNTAGKDKLKSIDKNQCVPRMKKLRGRIVRPAMSTAEIKASDERRKAEEEEEQRRKAEEEEQLRAKRAAADGKDSVPEDGNPVSEDDNPVPEDQQSAPTYSRSHLQVDEKDWCDKR